VNDDEFGVFVAIFMAFIVIIGLLTFGYLLAEIFFTPRQ
jgi:hypothetical protein